MTATSMLSVDGLEVSEDFTSLTGDLVLTVPGRRPRVLGKTAEHTRAEPDTLYLGRTLHEVSHSETDVLGRELLERPGDPVYDEVAAVLAPIVDALTYTFVGTRHGWDKVGVAYGGQTPAFDPAAIEPSIARIRDAHGVLDGLVGGAAPVLRFVFPDGHAWTELILFAPLRQGSGNARVQPVWYRVARIEGGEVAWVRYIDTFPPHPPRDHDGDPELFYSDLLEVIDDADALLAPGMQVELPDARLADQARHSLIRAAITRIEGWPKYGVLERLYGASEHDGFQDTFNADVTAALEWGLDDLAFAAVDNYLEHFVRDDGSIVYRGPELGQYGRMLTVLSQVASRPGGRELLARRGAKVDGIVSHLRTLREAAHELPPTHAAHGMLVGWCEADSCLELDPDRYLLPYLSNSAEVARGFLDLGRATGDATLLADGEALAADLQVAIGRTMLRDLDPPHLPVIAGERIPFHIAVEADDHDPQFRAYRANMELLFSGLLTAEEVDVIVGYREAHRDLVLGIPLAYGYTRDPAGALTRTPELAGFLSYGHGYGLLQHGRVREFLLELYALSAHQYTRGTWTAPETRRIDPALQAAGYAVPAQVAVPMLLKWMLVFEDPLADVLHLARAVPTAWLDDGLVVAVSEAPTRWGRVGYRIESHVAQGRISASVVLPPTAPETRLRLRLPHGMHAADLRDDTIVIPAGGGTHVFDVTVSGRGE